MFDIKKVKTSSFAYELDISKIIAKLHLAAAKFTKESANNKICITANSGIKNDDIKSPNPETPSSKLQFLIDDGPNYTVSIVAICKDLVNEYSLFNKPEYYDVATSMSTYENNDNKNKTQLDDMIETIEDNKQYVVPVMYQSKKDIFNKCFSEVKTIRENNEKAARETIAALFSNYFDNFMGKEAATTAANTSNLVYLDEVDIVDVIKDFEQQYKESGLLEYSNKLKDAHNKLIDKLNKEKPINNNTNNSNNSNNNTNTNTNNSNNSNTAQQHESKQTTFNNLMSLLFEDNPPQENNTQNNNQNNNQNNTDQKQAETSTNDENNKNNENNKLNVKFPEKVDKIYAYAVGYSLDVKQE